LRFVSCGVLFWENLPSAALKYVPPTIACSNTRSTARGIRINFSSGLKQLSTYYLMVITDNKLASYELSLKTSVCVDASSRALSCTATVQTLLLRELDLFCNTQTISRKLHSTFSKRKTSIIRHVPSLAVVAATRASSFKLI
jgi:hypothetical protein